MSLKSNNFVAAVEQVYVFSLFLNTDSDEAISHLRSSNRKGTTSDS